jgi:methionyl aminopeptidase
MALVKTQNEIEIMRRGGALLSRALKAAVDMVAPGVELRQLDAQTERVILEGGGRPSFKGYKSHSKGKPFPSTLCISVNEEVVHGLGNRDRKLKEGDVVGLDVGCWFEGLCTDMAVTVGVGTISPEARRLLNVTRAALMNGVGNAKVGGTIRDISSAVEGTVKPHGYGIVRALVGHGVGHEIHEDPQIPNFVNEQSSHVVIQDGMCLALEPMITLGGYEVETADDGWGIVTQDRSLSAHFEVTIAITKDGTEILTPLPI